MRCPRCSGLEDKVIQSRISRDGDSIRRRRECITCGCRFTTYETIEDFFPVVIKKDGRREPFNPEKVISGLTKACEKRPVSMETIVSIKDAIVSDIHSTWEKEVPSSYIGEKIMDALHGVDPIAYVRFASVYREFKDVREFMQEIKGLGKAKK
ncbi:MAG TPA: transcriptional repressor NrdR [Deltaproteobacteria bacterium]|nr:transcriptional repressor NrdR [Deltaproteobacteria bacterium]